MALPTIDFKTIANTAKEALAAYGSPVTFLEGQADTTGRTIRAVIWEQNPETLVMDVDSRPAYGILSPDDFAAPNRMPRKFDRLRIVVGTFTRTYTIDSDPAPILAEAEMPLLRVVLRSN